MSLRLGFALALAISASVAVGCSDLGEPFRLVPQPEVSTIALDFGTVAVGGSATRTVTVSNAGTADFTGIAGVSCPGFTLDSGAGPFTVPPGGRHQVVVRFTPGGVGSFMCELMLGVGLEPVALEGQASNQLPGSQCVVTPLTLEFGSLFAGQSRLLAFKIHNPGTAPTSLDVVSDRPTFAILSGAGAATLAPGDSVTVTVSFVPAASGADSCLIATGPGCPQVRGRGFGTTVSFARDIRPIMGRRFCDSCHEFRTTSQLVNVTSQLGYAPAVLIQPFNLSGSVLYGKITNSGQYGQLMPEGGPLMPLSERNLFRDWILEGATNN